MPARRPARPALRSRDLACHPLPVARQHGRIAQVVHVLVPATGAIAAMRPCGYGRRGLLGPGDEEPGTALLGLEVAVAEWFKRVVRHSGMVACGITQRPGPADAPAGAARGQREAALAARWSSPTLGGDAE